MPAAAAVPERATHRLLSVLEHAPIAFYRVRLRPDVHLEHISSGFGHFSGYPVEELAHDPGLIWRTVHPDDRTAVQAIATDSGKTAPHSPFRLVHRDGRVLTVEHVVFITRDERGLPASVDGLVRDVTRAGAPAAAAGGAEWDRAGAAIYLADAAGFTRVTPEIESLTGFSVGDWIRQPTLWAERLHPDDRARMLFLSTAGAAGQTWQAEYRWIARDGRIVWIRQASAPIRDESGELVCLHGFMLNSTARHEPSEKTIPAHRMDAIAQLAGIVAHDLNNLLTVVLGHAEMLLDRFRDAGGSRESALEIRHAGESGARIANQLLALSGRQSLAPAIVDVNELIRALADTLHELAGGESEVQFDLGSDLPPVETDVKQFERVLRNLVVDARDAMPGGGRITIATRAGDRGDRREVRLTIADARRQEARDGHVSPFEPVLVSRKSIRGASLNRAAIYGIVRQAGGEISAEYRAGGGLVLTIVLPAAVARS